MTTTTTTTTSGAADLLAMVSKALREAYNLGQRYWQQADSEYISQHKKADDTRAKFLALAEETCAALAAGQATAQQAAPATQQAGEVRRAELVPGVMHCAKCKFQLNRVTLCVSDGHAYAGNNKTEPCPNGCGPLWPVTWEQEAKNCWKALEEMHERLMAAAAPQPSPTAQADNKKKDPL